MSLVTKRGSHAAWAARLAPRLLLFVAPLLASCSSFQDDSPIGRQVAAIVAADGSPGRARAIMERLDSLGIEHREQRFRGTFSDGVNILALLPGAGTRKVLLGAHLDQVPVGQGAVDNAAGCALLLELLARLKDSPPANRGVAAVFFDYEEEELLGSKTYVARAQAAGALPDERLPAIYLNFDIFAYGDTLWLNAPKGSRVAARAAETFGGMGLRFRLTDVYPPSDHVSFLDAGVDAAALTLIDGGEIDPVIGVLNGGAATTMPHILKVIHSAGDKLDEVDPAAILAALPAVERLIRALDAEPGPR